MNGIIIAVLSFFLGGAITAFFAWILLKRIAWRDMNPIVITVFQRSNTLWCVQVTDNDDKYSDLTQDFKNRNQAVARAAHLKTSLNHKGMAFVLYL